jgi:hypothetical protein
MYTYYDYIYGIVIYIYGKREMGGACSKDGRGERRVQGFGGET